MRKIINLILIITTLTTISCTKSIYTKTSPVYSLVNSQVSNGYLETELDILNHSEASVSGLFKRTYFGIERGIAGKNRSYIDDSNTLVGPNGNIDKAKSWVLYEATKKAKCDIMIAPVYSINVKQRLIGRDKFTISVKGVAANIKSIKQTAINPNK